MKNIGFFIISKSNNLENEIFLTDIYSKFKYSYFINKRSNDNVLQDWFNYINNLNIKKEFYLYGLNLKGIYGHILLKNIIDIYKDKTNVIMDKNNNIIEIKIYQNYNIIIRDFSRIFPIEYEIKDKNLKNKKYILNHMNRIFIFYKKYLYNKYNVNILSIYSLSNISYKIFYNNYNKLPKISLSLYENIKYSYYPTKVNVYKNYGVNLYQYDINSLYPYVMLNYMPNKYIGYKKNINIIDIINNIETIGFYYCKIENKSIKYPKLFPNYNKNNYIFGLYFSEEIKLWYNLGYNIMEINYGYEFSKKKFFNSFVKENFSLKNKYNYIKDNYFLNKFYKGILNGLYGYLGRYPYKTQTKIIFKDNKKDLNNLLKNYVLLSIKNLDNCLIIEYINNKYFFNEYTNICIFSAITSYARIYLLDYMSKINSEIYYNDIDCLILKKVLNYKDVNNKLGKFKLVNFIKEAYFLHPKLYAYKNIKNQEIVKSAGIPIGILKYNDFKEIFRGNLKFIEFEIINIEDFNYYKKKIKFDLYRYFKDDEIN